MAEFRTRANTRQNNVIFIFYVFVDVVAIHSLPLRLVLTLPLPRACFSAPALSRRNIKLLYPPKELPTGLNKLLFNKHTKQQPFNQPTPI